MDVACLQTCSMLQNSSLYNNLRDCVRQKSQTTRCESLAKEAPWKDLFENAFKKEWLSSQIGKFRHTLLHRYLSYKKIVQGRKKISTMFSVQAKKGEIPGNVSRFCLTGFIKKKQQHQQGAKQSWKFAFKRVLSQALIQINFYKLMSG